MSWGIKITCLYSGFVLFIAFLVSLTMRERSELVTPDYYAQELKYQEKIDQLERTANLEEPLRWELKDRRLYLNFPDTFASRAINGSIRFFRPSDARMDATIAIPVNAGKTEIPLGKLHQGMYNMQISWQVDTTVYYNAGFIQIQ